MSRCRKHLIINCETCAGDAPTFQPQPAVQLGNGLKQADPLEVISTLVSDAIQVMANIDDDFERNHAMHEFLRFEFAVCTSLLGPSQYGDVNQHVTNRIYELAKHVDEHRNSVSAKLSALAGAAGGN